MNGERGRHVKFWLFIAASLSFSSGPLSPIPRFGYERANAPNRATRDFSRLSLPSAVLYYECDISPSQDPFVLISPPPTGTTYLFLCISSPLANVLLNITTHYTPSLSTYLSLRLSFHLHLPLTLFLL